MSETPIDAQAELLLLKSAEDRVCLNYPLPSASFGFHAAQAVEKLLKALIAARGERFPFTHKLETLAGQLTQGGEVIPQLSCEFSELQPHAVLTRYDEAQEIEATDRERLKETVDELRSWVLARIAFPDR